MNEEKFKRVVIASTVGAVLLLVILISVLVYQLIAIGVQKKREEELVAKYEEYNKLTDEEKAKLEAVNSYWYIVQEAREMGYFFPDDPKAE